MKKRLSFLVATLIAIACGVAVYMFHQNRFLLEDSSLTSLGVALLLLGIPFGVDAVIGHLFYAELKDVELWKVLLGITITLPIVGIIIFENGLALEWGIDPIWIVDAQFVLPMVANYLFTLWAIFHKRRKSYKSGHHRPPAPPSPPSTPTTTTNAETETNAYGLPTGLPF